MSKRRRNPIIGYAVRFLAVFVLLSIPWPGLGSAYGQGFRFIANVLSNALGAETEVRFEPLPNYDPERDTLVRVSDHRTGAEVEFGGSSRSQGYEPTIFLISLILATPIDWRRRIKALLWGLVLINGFVLVRIIVFLVDGLSGSGQTSIVWWSPGPIGRPILDFLSWVFVQSFAGMYVLPAPIWFLVCFRRQDWSRFFEAAGFADPPRPADSSRATNESS